MNLPDQEPVSYALVGLTIPELAATRDCIARDVDDRREHGQRVPPNLKRALDKATHYLEARLRR